MYDPAVMSRQVASDNVAARKRWPLLFWSNWILLVLAAVFFAIWIGGAFYQGQQSGSGSNDSPVALIPGTAFVLGSVFALAFVVTGYVRLFRVHRLPEHRIRSPGNPVRRRAARVLGLIVVAGGVVASWLHWNVQTAVAILLVVPVLYFVQRWR